MNFEKIYMLFQEDEGVDVGSVTEGYGFAFGRVMNFQSTIAFLKIPFKIQTALQY